MKKVSRKAKLPPAEVIAAALDGIVDRHEVAEILGITAPRVDQLAAQGRLTPYKRWGRVLYLRSEVEAFAETPRLPGTPGRLDRGE